MTTVQASCFSKNAPSSLLRSLRLTSDGLSELVHGVDLKDGLGGIQADHGDAHRGRFLSCRSPRSTQWHTADGRGVHPIWGDRFYERTRIDEGRGERWFCSEKEAADAGFRAPLLR
jgi:hypothetical protein